MPIARLGGKEFGSGKKFQNSNHVNCRYRTWWRLIIDDTLYRGALELVPSLVICEQCQKVISAVAECGVASSNTHLEMRYYAMPERRFKPRLI